MVAADLFRRSRRRIVWDDFVRQAVLDRYEAYPRLYEVMKNFEWLLERQPDNNFAERIDDTHWIIKSDNLFFANRTGVPEVLLIYFFDDRVVTFYDIRIVPRLG